MKINTVLGPIEPAALGQTLMHEHLSCADWSMRENFGARFYEADKVEEMAVFQLRRAMECGVHTFVDGTPVNLGRDIHLMRAVAERTGIQLIASSGFYYQKEPWLEGRDEEQIEDLLEYECREGISGTDSLPGILKAGVAAEGVTPLHHKLLRATGRVSAAVGLPIFCHHDPAAESGPEILDVLGSVGVAPNRVILGHSGDSNDLRYLTALAGTGCFLGFDRLGYCDRTNSLANYVRNIRALCEAGFSSQILLSHDLASYLAFWESWDAAKSRDLSKEPVDFTFIHKIVLPALAEGGIPSGQCAAFLTENPRRFFEGG